jgi:hypothetical protein
MVKIGKSIPKVKGEIEVNTSIPKSSFLKGDVMFDLQF